MLLLTRKPGEEVVIGHGAEITVRVLEIKRGKVRLGFIGPRDVPIHRREVWLEILKGSTEGKTAQPAA